MGSLADALDDAPASMRGQGRRGFCAVAAIIARLDDADRSALETALTADPGPSSPTVAAILDAAGYPVSSETVNKHRRGRCACSRSSSQ